LLSAPPRQVESVAMSHAVGPSAAEFGPVLKGSPRTTYLATDAGVVVGESDGPLPWFAVRHETPDAFMEPEWIVHPNGALAMMAVHAVAENPREIAKALKEKWSAKAEEILDGCMLVKTGTVELLIWSAAAYQSEYKAIEAMAPHDLPAIVGTIMRMGFVGKV